MNQTNPSQPEWPEEVDIYGKSGLEVKDMCEEAFNQWQSKRELDEEEIYDNLFESLYGDASTIGDRERRLLLKASKNLCAHFSRPASISEEVDIRDILINLYVKAYDLGKKGGNQQSKDIDYAEKRIFAKFGRPGIDREKIAEIIYNSMAPYARGGDNQRLEFGHSTARTVIDCQHIANAIADHLEGR